jgi:hypothetical protein
LSRFLLDGVPGGLPASVPEVLEERLDEEEECFLEVDDSRSAAILAEDPFLAFLDGFGMSSIPSEAIDPSSFDEDVCLDFLDSSSLTLDRETERLLDGDLLLRLLDGDVV